MSPVARGSVLSMMSEGTILEDTGTTSRGDALVSSTSGLQVVVLVEEVAVMIEKKHT